MKNNVTLAGYVPLSPPSLLGNPQYLARELQAISSAIQNLTLMTPQPATKAPVTLSDGMIRLARSPWRPLSGQTTDEWVFYDAPSGTWKLLNAS